MSLTFNGSTSKLAIAQGVVSSFPCSMFCWVKPSTLAQSTFVLCAGNGNNELALYADLNASVRMRGWTNELGSAVTFNATTTPTTTWQPCLLVFTSTTSRAIYYAGGAVVTNSASSNPVPSGFNKFSVGNRDTAGTLFFNGDIAEVAVWSSSLVQADFDALAAGAKPENVQSGTLIDAWSLTTQAATQTGVNGRVLTATSTSQGAVHPIDRSAGMSGGITLDDIIAAGTLASIPSSLSGGITLDDLVAAGTLGRAPGVLTAGPFKNWAGLLLANVTIPKVAVLRVSDMTLIYSATNVGTNAGGIMTLSDVTLYPGVQYLLVTCNADGSAFGCAPLVAT